MRRSSSSSPSSAARPRRLSWSVSISSPPSSATEALREVPQEAQHPPADPAPRGRGRRRRPASGATPPSARRSRLPRRGPRGCRHRRRRPRARPTRSGPPRARRSRRRPPGARRGASGAPGPGRARRPGPDPGPFPGQGGDPKGTAKLAKERAASHERTSGCESAGIERSRPRGARKRVLASGSATRVASAAAVATGMEKDPPGGERSEAMPEKKVIAVVGATGAQGGGLVRAILDDPSGGFAARGITRNTRSDRARASPEPARRSSAPTSTTPRASWRRSPGPTAPSA